MVLIAIPARAGEVNCADVVHRPAGDVAASAPAGVAPATLDGETTVDVSKIDIPLVADLLKGRTAGGRPLVGEARLGTVTTDGQTTTIQGAAINGGKPLVIAPDCRPKRPVVERPAIRQPR